MTTLYRLLTGPDDSAFCHKVTQALEQGWQLHGSPTMTFNSTSGIVMCAQAVTKKVDAAYDPDRKLGEY